MNPDISKHLQHLNILGNPHEVNTQTHPPDDSIHLIIRFCVKPPLYSWARKPQNRAGEPHLTLC